MQPGDALSVVHLLQSVHKVLGDLVHAGAANGLAW